jgi:hypothetical protein
MWVLAAAILRMALINRYFGVFFDVLLVFTPEICACACWQLGSEFPVTQLITQLTLVGKNVEAPREEILRFIR